MSEGHGEPPADVRSFLPRPGEPVEEYAERLRTLHRDLTLVLQAVERGLAAASDPASAPPPVPAADPVRDYAREAQERIEIVSTHPAGPHPEAEGVRPPRPMRGPRVEVLPPRTGEQRRFDAEDRRMPEPLPAPTVEAARPEPRFHPDPAIDSVREGAATTAEAPRPTPRFPARPSAKEPAETREPEWVEHEPESFTPPQFPAAPAATAMTVTKPMLAAFAAAWLVVVALLVALLVA